MADMYDCGRHTHDSWKKPGSFYERWLGPYDSKMSVDEVQRRLENYKLTDDAQRHFERGFLDARKKAHEND